MALDGLEILNHELFLCLHTKKEAINERITEDAHAVGDTNFFLQRSIKLNIFNSVLVVKNRLNSFGYE